MNNIESNFVSYQIAVDMKSIGFDEPCLAKYAIYNPKDSIALFPQSQDFFKGYFNYCKNSDYTDKIAAPTFSQAFRWFREKFDIHTWIDSKRSNNLGELRIIRYMPIFDLSNKINLETVGYFFTYEEAELACLQKLIQIVKNEKHTHITNKQTK